MPQFKCSHRWNSWSITIVMHLWDAMGRLVLVGRNRNTWFVVKLVRCNRFNLVAWKFLDRLGFRDTCERISDLRSATVQQRWAIRSTERALSLRKRALFLLKPCTPVIRTESAESMSQERERWTELDRRTVVHWEANSSRSPSRLTSFEIQGTYCTAPAVNLGFYQICRPLPPKKYEIININFRCDQLSPVPTDGDKYSAVV